jgi:uncharacterized protein YjbJ (UPF0337 family)
MQGTKTTKGCGDLMKIGNVDLNALRGLVDKGIGLQKEVLGTVLGRENLSNEGKAQQERGSAHLQALKAEAQAQKARGQAAVQEKRQAAAARGKRT